MPATTRHEEAAWIYVVVVGRCVLDRIIFSGSLQCAEQDGIAPPECSNKSIAVLPFDNLSRDPDNAYFCEGVQDEILTRLAKVADLKVISRTSTQHFKSAPDNLPEIAKQLGVAHILEGSVQKASDQVRVNVQLINAMTDAHLWADTYDRKLTDIFAVESDIAKTIADTLQAKLTGSEKRSMAKTPTVNPEAYELYLKGRYFWNKRTGDDLRKSIEYLKQAIAKDPGYALAYAALADSYSLLRFYGGASPAESVVPAEAAAKKALELDDSLAEAHASLGLIATEELEVNRGVNELERAIQLNPNYATAHHWLGLALATLRQSDRSIGEAKARAGARSAFHHHQRRPKHHLSLCPSLRRGRSAGAQDLGNRFALICRALLSRRSDATNGPTQRGDPGISKSSRAKQRSLFHRHACPGLCPQWTNG